MEQPLGEKFKQHNVLPKDITRYGGVEWVRVLGARGLAKEILLLVQHS